MPATPDLLSGLNDQQRTAVTHDRGPLMVLAGPGTGKTRVIAYRIAHLMGERGVPPERIVAVTYTVKAAAQLRERLADLAGADADGVHAHTFHGLGLRIIRRFADVVDVSLPRDDAGGSRGWIVDSAQQRRMLGTIIMEHGLFRHARAQGIDTVVDRVSQYASVLCDAGVSPEQAEKLAEEAERRVASGKDSAGHALDTDAVEAERVKARDLFQAARAIGLFERACRERRLLTFGDLIALPIRILKTSAPAAAILRHEWRHVVVDEFQDANTAQIEFLRLLMPPDGASGGAKAGPDLCVVGDDDQSIYAFRGADDLAFDRFAKTWTAHTVVPLTGNYRSCRQIVRVANAIIGRATRRFAPDKTIEAADRKIPDRAVDCVHLEDERQDGEAIAAMILIDRSEHPERRWSDYAVVARTHGDVDRVRAALELEGVPSIAAREGSPSEDEGVRDVLAWVQLLADPHCAHIAARVMMRPPFSIDLARVHPLVSAYRSRLTRSHDGDPGTQDPGGFVDWLGARAGKDPAIARFVAVHHAFRQLAAERPAAEVVFRIMTGTDAAHADLLGARDRAERVANLITLLRFARQRQERLDQPGDIRTFWSYFQDLSDRDRELRDSALDERIDGSPAQKDAEDRPDAVRLITAHSAKGLEFHTVFVPRISPAHGYGKAGEDDGPALPEGVIRAGDQRTPKERAQAEARRLFYVACTRAMNRLVLLSKKNKSRSKSTHYFEEIVHDDGLKPCTRVIDAAELFRRAASLKVGRTLGRVGDEAGRLDAEAKGFRGVERRREVFEHARRELRTAAAGAMDEAESRGGNPAAVEASGRALADAAARLGALAEAERTGRVPNWAAKSDIGGFVADVLARARSEEEDGQAHGAIKLGPGLNKPLRLSYSSIKDYLECPRCFYFKHVLGVEPLPDADRIVGIAVHEALERFYKEVRAAEGDGSRAPDRERLVQLGRNAFFEHWPRHLEVDRKQLDQALAQLGLTFDRLHDSGCGVVEIEKRVEFEYGEHTMECRIDRVDQFTGPDGALAFRVVDYKTGNASNALRQPRPDDLQMGLYARALAALFERGDPGANPLPGVAEYWILSTGERGVLPLDTIRHDKIAEQIDKAVKGMLDGRWERGKECRGECEVLGPIAAARAPEQTAAAVDTLITKGAKRSDAQGKLAGKGPNPLPFDSRSG